MGTALKRAGIALGAVVAALGIAAALYQTPLGSSLLGGAAGQAGNAVANAALDASGVKGKIDQALRSRASEIASATGLSESEVNAAIDSLDIESWQVATLPSGATSTGSVNTSYQGVDATVTTYDDPGYVTVDAGGTAVTLAVPESAQGYTGYLTYLAR